MSTVPLVVGCASPRLNVSGTPTQSLSFESTSGPFFTTWT